MPEGQQNNLIGQGPGATPVGVIGIILLAVYLVAAVLLCLYGLVALWPAPNPARTQPTALVDRSITTPASTGVSPTPNASSSAPGVTPGSSAQLSVESVERKEPAEVSFFLWRFTIWDEIRLLLIVILAGALGSLVHALRSVYWYVGNRGLVWSWFGKYLLLPFGGSALAVIFYVVVRGGFFSPQANFEQTSPFGFAALAAMVGLFSEQAVLKLKEIAETVLAKPQAGEDSKPQD